MANGFGVQPVLAVDMPDDLSDRTQILAIKSLLFVDTPMQRVSLHRGLGLTLTKDLMCTDPQKSFWLIRADQTGSTIGVSMLVESRSDLSRA